MDQTLIQKKYLGETLQEITWKLPHYSATYCGYLQELAGSEELYNCRQSLYLIPREMIAWAEFFCERDRQGAPKSGVGYRGLGASSAAYLNVLTDYARNPWKWRRGRDDCFSDGKRSMPQRIAVRLINRLLSEMLREPSCRCNKPHYRYERLLWILTDVASSARRKGFLDLQVSTLPRVNLETEREYWMLGVALKVMIDGCQSDKRMIRFIRRMFQAWRSAPNSTDAELMLARTVQRFLIALVQGREKSFLQRAAVYLSAADSGELLSFIKRVVPESWGEGRAKFRPDNRRPMIPVRFLKREDI